ncbi:MAG: hypothetical protein AAGB12_15095 [Pseudomonadota bacterium]
MKQFLEQKSLPTKMQITCDNYHISRSVVMSSNFFTGGPKQLFTKALRSGDLVSVEVTEKIIWQAFCLTRPESVYTPTVKKFIDIVAQYTD